LLVPSGQLTGTRPSVHQPSRNWALSLLDSDDDPQSLQARRVNHADSRGSAPLPEKPTPARRCAVSIVMR
jgi:hypothetical protein